MRNCTTVTPSNQHSTDAAVEDSERIFTKLIRSVENQRCEVRELIRAQEESALGQAEGLLKRVGRELEELERKDAELEQLSLTEDHIHFLQVTLLMLSIDLNFELHSTHLNRHI